MEDEQEEDNWLDQDGQRREARKGGSVSGAEGRASGRRQKTGEAVDGGCTTVEVDCTEKGK